MSKNSYHLVTLEEKYLLFLSFPDFLRLKLLNIFLKEEKPGEIQWSSVPVPKAIWIWNRKKREVSVRLSSLSMSVRSKPRLLTRPFFIHKILILNLSTLLSYWWLSDCENFPFKLSINRKEKFNQSRIFFFSFHKIYSTFTILTRWPRRGLANNKSYWHD